MTTEHLKLNDVAKLLGRTPRQVRNLLASGMPKHGRGRDVYFLWNEVLTWWIDHQLAQRAPKQPAGEEPQPELTAAQARKYDIEAQRSAVKLAREQKQVIAISDVETVLEQAFSVIKQRLRAMRSALVPRLAATNDKAKVADLLDKEVQQCLEELADVRIEAPTDARGN